MENLVPRKEALKMLGIHYNTIFKMAKEGRINYVKIGNKYHYNVNKYLKEHGIKNPVRRKICYCRVSSQKQKDDLKR